jgi:hypothetical protein
MLVALGVLFMIYAIGASIRNAIADRTKRSPEHEMDGVDALRYLLHESRWAEREHRRLNFREFIDHLAEFRRAAKDDGLRTSGLCIWGGPLAPIDRRHWIDAAIDPETIDRPRSVRTKSLLSRHIRPQEYMTVAVRTEDIIRIWPRASAAGRAWTKIYLFLNRQYYYVRGAWEYECQQWNTIRDDIPKTD